MIEKLPKSFSETISRNNGLSMYLSNLTKGREFTPRSWLFEQYSPDQILENWLEILSQLEDGNAFERKVFQFDTSQKEKWGPQGGIAPISELLDSIVLPSFSGAASPPPKTFDTTDWALAKERNRQQYAQEGLLMMRPASYKHVVDDMRARDTLESNSGWPDFTRRNKPAVIRSAETAAKTGEWIDYPAIILFRNYNLKTRMVWMFPMAVNLVEGSFFQPLQSKIVKQHVPFFAPWEGFEHVRVMITKAYDEGKFLAASDFTSTDEHFQLPASREVFDVLSSSFQRKYQGDFWQSLERMHTIPLIVGKDEMITGNHGVSSGSNWTNFVETVFDRLLSEYVRVKSDQTHEGLCAIGDDMCWIAATFDDAFATNLEYWSKEVGQVVKAEKTTNEPDSVKFLQRLFQRGYKRPDGLERGVYSTIRALKSSVYPERFHKPQLWSSDMFCARQYMILENCVDHPLFEQFVRFVVNGQKDLIPFAKKTKADLDRIGRETKLLPGLNPTYNQEKRDHSLADFEAIRVARNL